MPYLKWKRIVTFLVAITLLSTAAYTLVDIRKAGTAYLMCAPGLAALIVQLIHSKSLRGMGWKWGKTRYQALAVAIPLGVASIGYGLIWATGLGKLNVEALLEMVKIAPGDISVKAGILFLVFGTLVTLGEELGWRGYLVPELARVTTFSKTAFFSGAIWAIWHYPAMILYGYRSAAPMWFSMPCFTVMVIALSFVLAWLRLKSGSLWTGVFLHALHNTVIHMLLDPITADTGSTSYFAGEFGIVMAIGYVVVALLFWRRRVALPQ